MASPLDLVARPLRFAARNGFANLAVLKDLELSLLDALAQAEREADQGSLEERAIAAIRALATGIDRAEPVTKASRIREILAVIAGVGRANVTEACPDDAEARGTMRARSNDAPRSAAPTGEESTRRTTPGVGRALPPGKRVRPCDARLTTPLRSIVGIGPKTAERFQEKGLVDVHGALLFLPRRYEDRRAFTAIGELRPGEHATVRGSVIGMGIRFSGPRKRVFELIVGDGAHALSCLWFRFQAKAMERRFEKGQPVIASGTVGRFGAKRQMIHPEIEILASPGDGVPQGLVPVYPEVDGVPPRKVRRILLELSEHVARKLEDPLPEGLRARCRLEELGAAVRAAHDPKPEIVRAAHADLDRPDERPVASTLLHGTASLRRRLVFDELFYLQLALALRRRGTDEEPGFTNASPDPWDAIASSLLPFSLTGAQRRALAEITGDLASPRPMSRLLQGDVGSGKTAVALVAAAVVMAAGRQVALLAPTEILAMQHFKSAEAIFSRGHARTALLSGSTRANERRALLRDLEQGEIDLVIGTHAILEEDVVFHELGLCIVDEQHRFGVAQRATLRAKGNRRGERAGDEDRRPDMLVMTATPIPRTLALTLYGDLRVTVLDELPPGRHRTATRLLPKERKAEAYEAVRAAIDRGGQAYVVFPLVEASEKMDLAAATEAFSELDALFRPHRVALLHGRMSAEEKFDAMAAFASGGTSVLVSTTVIEVGVDVPGATVIVVEHAERFGLSQIHQLRGRVGRGREPGSCLLLLGDASEEARRRLEILEQSSDGFEVAEHDLLTRGPGELLGTKQSGLPDAALAEVVRDPRTLEEARREAFAMVDADPNLGAREHCAIKAELRRRFGGVGGGLALVDIG